MAHYGERVRQWRKARGLSLRDVSARTGISRSSLGLLETTGQATWQMQLRLSPWIAPEVEIADDLRWGEERLAAIEARLARLERAQAVVEEL